MALPMVESVGIERTGGTPHMSRIYILRHAKAANPFPGQKDFERPLTQSGLEAATRLGAWMAAQGLVPDRIVCSPALRTRQTLDMISSFFRSDVPVTFEQTLYSEDHEAYVAAARTAGTEKSVMIVGHNPTCEEFASSLVESGNPAAMNNFAPGMRPGAMAIIDFPGSLEEVGKRNGFLEDFVTEGVA